MPHFVRSALVAGFAATVVAAGVITVAPEAVASAPRLTTARISESAVLMASSTVIGQDGCSGCYMSTGSLLFDPTTSVTYEEVQPNAGGDVDAGAGGLVVSSVSHQLGLIPHLLAEAINPSIVTAILGSKTTSLMAIAPKILEDVAEFGDYANAAGTVVGRQMEVAMSDTFTPTQWGGGKVLRDWRNVGGALNAMTIGIGANVDGVWVASLRVAAFSIRNQIANDIAGRTSSSIGWLPHYARDYTPTSIVALPAYPAVGSCSDCGCSKCDSEVEAAAAKSARAKTVGSAARIAAKAAATPKAAAARTRSAKLVSRN
jgi:hypothetical protein